MIKATRTELKNEAVKRMKLLEIHCNAIEEFDMEDRLNVSEFMGILYWLNTKDVLREIKEIEEKYEVMVYHVILTNTEYGKLYSFLYVSEDVEMWEQERKDIYDNWPCCYVYNQEYPYDSEFGGIKIDKINGGLMRTA